LGVHWELEIGSWELTSGYTAQMPEPATRPADDAPMRRLYALVILCHAAVITILWWIGRTFSR